MSSKITGTAAGVPFVAFGPDTESASRAPVVIAWHLMAPPRSEAALAAALPLDGLDAWRIYLGLPMHGARSPEGGFGALMQLAAEDAVLKVHGPVATQAAEEFAPALAELRRQLDLRDGPVGLVGGSIGGAVAQLVLTDAAPTAGITVSAAVLVSPVTRLDAMVEAAGRQFGMTYPWTPPARAVADRLDFVARADDFVKAGQPAVQIIVGADDDREGFEAPATQLRDALSERYDDPSRVELRVVAGMGHGLAEEPGLEPAPQTPEAKIVDGFAVSWLARYLT
jgi:pimeloyl-ACP methyl ester carboxylesterase